VIRIRTDNIILRKYFLPVLLILVLLFTTASVLAAGEEPEGLWADRITSFFADNGVDLLIAEGNALLVYEDYHIKADYIEYDYPGESIEIKGNISLSVGDYFLRAKSLSGNLNEKSFVARDEVYFQADDLKINSISLEMKNEGLFIFTGNVLLLYKEIQVQADSLNYEREQDLLVLEGNINGQNGDLKLSGERMELDLNSEKIKLQGRAELLFGDKGGE